MLTDVVTCTLLRPATLWKLATHHQQGSPSHQMVPIPIQHPIARTHVAITWTVRAIVRILAVRLLSIGTQWLQRLLELDKESVTAMNNEVISQALVNHMKRRIDADRCSDLYTIEASITLITGHPSSAGFTVQSSIQSIVLAATAWTVKLVWIRPQSPRWTIKP